MPRARGGGNAKVGDPVYYLQRAMISEVNKLNALNMCGLLFVNYASVSCQNVSKVIYTKLIQFFWSLAFRCLNFPYISAGPDPPKTCFTVSPHLSQGRRRGDGLWGGSWGRIRGQELNPTSKQNPQNGNCAGGTAHIHKLSEFSRNLSSRCSWGLRLPSGNS